LESANLDLNVNNEASLKKQEILEKKLDESSSKIGEQTKKDSEELIKTKEKLDKAETLKVMIEKKMNKVE
jgi:hypothetical protein